MVEREDVIEEMVGSSIGGDEASSSGEEEEEEEDFLRLFLGVLL